MPVPCILFDDGKGLLSPLNDLRASFEIRTGALTTAERLTAALDVSLVGFVVPRHLVELMTDSAPVPVNRPPHRRGTPRRPACAACQRPVPVAHRRDQPSPDR
jgi:hypothetical protein